MSDIVTLIQEKIAAGYIIEAGTLLKLHANNIADEKRNALQQTIAELAAAAEELVNQAKAEENKGNIEEGLRLLHEAEKTVADFPDLQATATRMNDTVALTRALKNRSLRRTKPPNPVKSGRRAPKKLITACLLIALLIISAWFIWKSPFSQLAELKTVPQEKDATKLLPEIQATSPATPQFKTTSVEQPIATPPVEETAKNRDAVSLVQKAPVPPATTNTKASIASAVGTTGQKNVPDQVIVPLQQASRLSSPSNNQSDKRPPSNQPPPKDSARTYIIQPGDTLSSIANRLFCNEKERGKLYVMNKDRLSDPSSIHPGVEIRLETDTINIANRCNR